MVVPDKARRRRMSGRFLGALEKQPSEASLNVDNSNAPRSRRNLLHVQQGNEDFSESAYDDGDTTSRLSESFSLLPNSLEFSPGKSNRTTLHKNGSTAAPLSGSKSHKKRSRSNGYTQATAGGIMSLANFTNLLQLLVLVVLAGIVFDGHHRVKKHKVQLQQYDEERAHLLEQMMWIDKAAKKVHQKAQLDKDVHAETKEELEQDVLQSRQELEKLQLRIQLNARDQLSSHFDDKPVQARLQIQTIHNEKELHHIVMALSEDTPHAAATLVNQIEKHLWDEIIYQKVTDETSGHSYVQATAKHPITTPLLEFVEKSRGCSERGSVALRQLEERDLHVIVLRFNMQANTPMDDYDVCVGTVVHGLELLEAVE